MKNKKTIFLGLLALTTLVLFNFFSCKDESEDDSLKIGDSYQGGIIAYILLPNNPGYDPDVQHGIIAAAEDIESALWGCNGTLIGGTSSDLGKGQANTTLIVNGCSESSCAAKLCNDLVLNGYDDWYLPSEDELSMLFYSQAKIGGFENDLYWSSSEYEDIYAWAQYFDPNDGYHSAANKDVSRRVRPVRSF